MRRCVILLVLLLTVAGADVLGDGKRRAVAHRSAWWSPSIGASWHIQYEGALDAAVDVGIYDVDGLDTPAEDIAALRRVGRRVICYVNAGAWEEWRADADLFPASVIGNEYAGWQGEKWLDIRQIALLAPILRRRLESCRMKGCDAVDPDNLDGYTQATGFPLTASDQLAFNRFIAREAHARNLGVALKNDFAQAAELAADFDFAVAESCFLYRECELLLPFLERNKAVFDIEYTDTAIRFDDVCVEARALKIVAVLKNRSLDAWRQPCP